ncbi:MAG: hypothetical protein ACRC8Y_12720 [Chroococcales cyanobacterium]
MTKKSASKLGALFIWVFFRLISTQVDRDQAEGIFPKGSPFFPLNQRGDLERCQRSRRDQLALRGMNLGIRRLWVVDTQGG